MALKGTAEMSEEERDKKIFLHSVSPIWCACRCLVFNYTTGRGYDDGGGDVCVCLPYCDQYLHLPAVGACVCIA